MLFLLEENKELHELAKVHINIIELFVIIMNCF